MLRAVFESLVAVSSEYGGTDERQAWAELNQQFREIMNLAQKFSARRNDIAHGFVQPWPSLPPPETNGFALFPTTYSTNKNTLKEPGEAPYLRTGWAYPDYIYTSVEIDAYAEKFSELEAKAAELNREFLKAKFYIT